MPDVRTLIASGRAGRVLRFGAAFVACIPVASCARDDSALPWGVANAQARPAQSPLGASAGDASVSPIRLPVRGGIDAGAERPDGAIEQPPAVAPSDHALRNLLGRRLAEIEADAGPPLDGGRAWQPFRGDVFVQFHGDRVMRITARVPPGTACEEAARRFGFDHAMAPLRHARACEWPARSEHHLIEAGLGARLDLRTGSFEVWVE